MAVTGRITAVCGSGALPCRTYNYARRLACSRSENVQDTVHVSHVINGYRSSCDMAGGSGHEPRILGTYDWGVIAVSLLFPTALVFVISLASFSWYYQRKRLKLESAPS